MTNETRTLLTNHALRKGYNTEEADKLIMEFNEIVEAHGYAIAYQQFIIKLLDK